MFKIALDGSVYKPLRSGIKFQMFRTLMRLFRHALQSRLGRPVLGISTQLQRIKTPPR
jgi:hypothetical protein